MQFTIEILLVVGIFVNIIKGADLILRPHQQKWLQDKSETLTLWLDYTRPLEWYISTNGLNRIIWSLHPVILFGVLVIQASSWGIKWLTATALIVWVLMAGVALVTSFTSSAALEEAEADTRKEFQHRLEFKIIDWLTNSKTLTQNFIRPLVMVGVATALSIPLVIGGYLSRRLFQSISDIHWLLASAASLPLIVLIIKFTSIYSLIVGTIVIGIVCLIALVFSSLFVIFELILKIIRGVVWRITEYNKGAFAAMILVVTISLGIIELFFKIRTAPVTPASTPVQTVPSAPDTSPSLSPQP